MAKIKVKQIPEVLSPTGERIMKIWYDENTMPPKNYIWCKGEDDYFIWNGKQWIPYEFEIIKQDDHSCHPKKTCGCITETELSAKFENFKKDLLSVVVKLINGAQDIDVSEITRIINSLSRNVTNIDNRVTTLENAEVDLDGYATEQWVEDKHYLTEHQSLDDYYTKTEIDNKAIDRDQLEELALDLGFVKMIDITLAEYNALPVKQQNVVYNITDAEAYHYDPSALDASISALRNRVSGVETSVSTMTPIVTRLNAIDHDAYLTSDDLSTVQDRLTSVETSIHNLESIDHSQFITSDDLADFEPIDPSSVVNPEDLEGYATEEYVDRAISNVINSAPAALDTLNELATALGNDANFATTVTNALANKADISDIPTTTSQLTNDSGFITQAYDDTNLRNRVSTLEAKPFDSYLTTDEEMVISASLNDLNDRVITLENGGYDDTALSNRVSTLESTVEELSIPTDTSDLTNGAGFITQTTANGLYEPKFTDLTGETDPEAAAQTHTSDNKIYITEVIEPEQGGE